jgi:hypothetical protein
VEVAYGFGLDPRVVLELDGALIATMVDVLEDVAEASS